MLYEVITVSNDPALNNAYFTARGEFAKRIIGLDYILKGAGNFGGNYMIPPPQVFNYPDAPWYNPSKPDFIVDDPKSPNYTDFSRSYFKDLNYTEITDTYGMGAFYAMKDKSGQTLFSHTLTVSIDGVNDILANNVLGVGGKSALFHNESGRIISDPTNKRNNFV